MGFSLREYFNTVTTIFTIHQLYSYKEIKGHKIGWFTYQGILKLMLVSFWVKIKLGMTLSLVSENLRMCPGLQDFSMWKAYTADPWTMEGLGVLTPPTPCIWKSPYNFWLLRHLTTHSLPVTKSLMNNTIINQHIFCVICWYTVFLQ